MLVTTFLIDQVQILLNLLLLAPHIPDVSYLLFSDIGNQSMNSSDDELPDIPGTQFPWMTDQEKDRGLEETGPSTSGKRYF